MLAPSKKAGEPPRPAPPRTYPDLHEHIAALERAGLLIRVDRAIDKDTEMHPLVRWQFRGGIPEHERKAFLFTNVVDGKGRRYDIPVIVGGMAASEEIYRIGMGVRPADQNWKRQLNRLIQENQPAINKILLDYGVPLLDENDRLIGAEAAAKSP